MNERETAINFRHTLRCTLASMKWVSLISVLFLSLFSFSQRLNDNYILRYPYGVGIKTFIEQKDNTLLIDNNSGEGKLDYHVSPTPRLGFGFSYKWINVATTVTRLGTPERQKKGLTQEFDFQWNLYFRTISADIRLQRYEGYYLENSEDIIDWTTLNNKFYQRNDLISQSIGGNVRYIRNNKKYSARAVFSQTERQLKSAGSSIFGLRWNILDVQADSSLVPFNFKYQLNDIRIKTLSINDVGIGFGYGYTFVKNKWFFNLGIMGFVLGQKIVFTSESAEFEQDGLQINFNSRGALGYHSDNTYFGLLFVNDQMRSNWQNLLDIDYSFSKSRLMWVKRIHLKENIQRDNSIWL